MLGQFLMERAKQREEEKAETTSSSTENQRLSLLRRRSDVGDKASAATGQKPTEVGTAK